MLQQKRHKNISGRNRLIPPSLDRCSDSSFQVVYLSKALLLRSGKGDREILLGYQELIAGVYGRRHSDSQCLA